MVDTTVSAAGHMQKTHVLFNMLKSKPDCAPGFLVDVNLTGMWTDEIFVQHANGTLLCRCQPSFYKEPFLYIIYSHGVHITAFNGKRLANHNIFIFIVPPNLTKKSPRPWISLPTVNFHAFGLPTTGCNNAE